MLGICDSLGWTITLNGKFREKKDDVFKVNLVLWRIKLSALFSRPPCLQFSKPKILFREKIRVFFYRCFAVTEYIQRDDLLSLGSDRVCLLIIHDTFFKIHWRIYWFNSHSKISCSIHMVRNCSPLNMKIWVSITKFFPCQNLYLNTYFHFVIWSWFILELLKPHITEFEDQGT